MIRPSEHANIYFQQLTRVLSIAATAIPFMVIGLGLLVKFGYMDSRFYLSDTIYGLLTIGFVLAALINYYFVFFRKDPPYRVFLTLSIIFHILAIGFLLFVAGMSSPFLIGWIILIIATDIYFGAIATYLSLGALYLTAWINFLLYPAIPFAEQISIVISLLFVTAVGFIISSSRAVHDRERIDLEKTRDRATFQRERLLALVNSMGDAVVTTDEKGLIKVYNAATLNLLDTNMHLAGKNIDDIIKFTNANGERVKIVDEAVKKKTVSSRSDLVHKFNDGESVRLYVNVAPVQPSYRSEGERGFIFIMRDITKEKSLEEERDEFVSVVSHELRTPVAIAEGNLSNIVLLQKRGAATSVIENAAKSGHEQILYLAKLVNDLGTLSRAERGVGAESEDLNLKELLEEMYNSYQPQAEEKKLHLNLELPPRLSKIRTSRLYLQEILQNLITNAIKYTKEGDVTIKAKQARDGITISVKDSGIGISKFDQKHMFEKFYRSEDYRTRESSGTGLGLYVCKKLAEKLGADISFESRLNHGSTFTLFIPSRHFVTNEAQTEPQKK